MNNFQRLKEIEKISKGMDHRKRKYKYLKLLKKNILLNFFKEDFVIVIPKQESSKYFRDVYGSKWRVEYERINGVRYNEAYSHFSEELFEETLKSLKYIINEKEENLEDWIYYINVK